MGSIFSKLSVILSIVGIIIIITGIGYIQQMYILVPGVILYLLSLIVSIIALANRETGFIKFVPFVFLIPIIPFVITLYSGYI